MILRADRYAILEAARALRDGALVAFPTETVYGLGADARSDLAVAAIYAAKARPRLNPLIVHASSLEMAARYGVIEGPALALAEAFWPGPLTLVVPRRPSSPVSDLVTAGLDTLALRVPGHAIARELIQAADLPVAAPSANPSGRVSPTRAEDVAESLGGKVRIILDAGPSAVGVESTILGVVGGRLTMLRPGGLARRAIESVVGPLAGMPALPRARLDRPSAPGQLASHYAPDAPVRLDAVDVGPEEALLAFGPRPLLGAKATVNLSPSGDLREAAANLFRALRTLDAATPAAIAVMPIPDRDLGEAINDRLRRAAAPRPKAASRLADTVPG